MAAVIAFTSGKGGVGKTNISTNLGLSLLARNAKVCLFDADTGLANINILMGISPQYTIEHVLSGQKTIDEIILRLPSGICVVPAASGIKDCTNLSDQKIAVLTSTLEWLEERFDYLLIDTAAGIDSNVLDFVASAQYRVIIITSEPTSLTDSFALLKMLIIRGKKSSIFILVNKVKDYKTSQQIFQRFKKAVKLYLKIDVQYLGYLANDESINKAVSQQIPVVLSYPNSSVSCGFASLADIINRQFRNDKKLPYFSRYWTTNAEKSKTHIPSEPDLIPAKPVNEINLIENTESEEPLSNFYKQIDQQNLSEQEFKELLLTLESIYEKKHKKSLRDVNSIVALLLAEGDAKKIQQLHTVIGQSFERKFDKKINKPTLSMKKLLTNEAFSKEEFNRLMESCTAIYQKRFNEKYFSEGNKLLTQIEKLLSGKD